MIKNILFDLGGVIITLDPKQAEARFKEIGLADADRRLNTYTQSGLFGDLELGKIDAEGFRAGLSEIIGHEVTYEQCLYGWLGYCKDLPQRNLETLLRLRSEGYRIVLLSNTNPYMVSWVMSDNFDGKGHSLSHYMDSMYMSYKCGVMKPDRRFFQIVLDGEGIDPAETLFLDDGQRNVESAAALGIKTYLVENGSDWTKVIFDFLK